MNRRLLAVLLAAAACVLPGSTAVAAPARTSVAVATVASSQQLPQATVAAAWTVDSDKSDRLHSTGHNLPGTVSTVTASWSGTRRGDSLGRLLKLDHQYVYDAVREGATADIFVEYKLKGHWYSVLKLREDYIGTIGPLRHVVTEQLVAKAPAIAGKTVAVRISLVLRYPEPCFNVDDVFVVRA